MTRFLIPMVAVVGFVAPGTACKETDKAPQREIEAVRVSPADRRAVEVNLSSFCDVSYPSEGQGSRPFSAPAARPVPREGEGTQADPGAGGPNARVAGDRRGLPEAGRWRWINFWASWCGPCLREMPILDAWGTSLEKEGVAIEYEFWSVDEDASDLASLLSKRPRFPGAVRWTREPERIGAFFSGLGIDERAPIPVHVLVDARGSIRCVRVGEIRESLYGTVRTILMASTDDSSPVR